MSQTFGDLELAAKTKEVISTLVRKEVEKLRPAPRYATVASLDPVTVTYPGDPTPMPVKVGSVVPSAVGQIARIEGSLGDRYIADLVGAEEGVEPYEPGGNEFPDGIIIGDPDDPDGWTPILPQPPSDVTGLTVTQGLEFENIYFIIEWDLIPGATEYEVEVAEKLGANTYDLAKVVRTSAFTARVDGLQPFTEYGVRVAAISNIGLRGTVTPWLDVITTGDNTIPPQVAAPVLTRGATSLIVSFDPLDSLAAPDVANGNGLYEVQIDTVNTFNGANLRTNLTTASIVAFSDLTFQATWYARVRGIDTSGNLGAWSNVASLTAGAITSDQIGTGAITEIKIADDAITSPKINANAVIAEHILAGQISSDKIVTVGLDAAVIKFGSMYGDRILANSMTVDKLTTSTLTSRTITLGSGGTFRIGNPTTNGIFINDQGIRAYKNGATSFQIDSSGNATFAGSLSAGINISSPSIFGGSISAAVFRSGQVGNPRIEIQTGAFESGGLAENAIRFFVTSAATNGIVGGFYNQKYLAIQSAYSNGEQPGRLTVAPNASHLYSGWNGFTGVETEIFLDYGTIRMTNGWSYGTLRWKYTDHPFLEIGRSGIKSLTSADRLQARKSDDSGYADFWCNTLTQVSSVRFKKNVEDVSIPKGLIQKLKPKKFNRLEDPDFREEEFAAEKAKGKPKGVSSRTALKIPVYKEWGFLAEDMAEIFPEAVGYDEDGEPEGINYSMLIPVLVSELQRLTTRLEALEGAVK